MENRAGDAKLGTSSMSPKSTALRDRALFPQGPAYLPPEPPENILIMHVTTFLEQRSEKLSSSASQVMMSWYSETES